MNHDQLHGKIRRGTGQSLAEYGIILALLAVACIGALTTMGDTIRGKLGDLNTGTNNDQVSP